MTPSEFRKMQEDAGELMNPFEDVKAVIGSFSQVNPEEFLKWYKIKTQQLACDRLLKRHGLEKVTKIVRALKQTNKTQFFPKIYTPRQLEEKWQSLHDAYARTQNTIRKII